MIWFDSLSLKKKKPRSFMHLCGHVSVGNLGLKLKKTSANISLDFERKGCAAHRSTSWWWWRGPRRRGRVPEWHKARSYQSSSSSIPSSARHPQSPWRQTDGAAGQETCQTDASVLFYVILLGNDFAAFSVYSLTTGKDSKCCRLCGSQQADRSHFFGESPAMRRKSWLYANT